MHHPLYELVRRILWRIIAIPAGFLLLRAFGGVAWFAIVPFIVWIFWPAGDE
jgi:hypothetical protein